MSFNLQTGFTVTGCDLPRVTFIQRIERVRVWFRNIPVWPTGVAVRHLSKAIRNDPGYYIAWQATIACGVKDNSEDKLSWEESNIVAERLMKTLFYAEKPHSSEGSHCATPVNPK